MRKIAEKSHIEKIEEKLKVNKFTEISGEEMINCGHLYKLGDEERKRKTPTIMEMEYYNRLAGFFWEKQKNVSKNTVLTEKQSKYIYRKK